MMHHGSRQEVGMRRTIRHHAHNAVRVLQNNVHCDAYIATMHVRIVDDDHNGLALMSYA